VCISPHHFGSTYHQVPGTNWHKRLGSIIDIWQQGDPKLTSSWVSFRLYTRLRFGIFLPITISIIIIAIVITINSPSSSQLHKHSRCTELQIVVAAPAGREYDLIEGQKGGAVKARPLTSFSRPFYTADLDYCPFKRNLPIARVLHCVGARTRSFQARVWPSSADRLLPPAYRSTKT
jgi:hypothetical protein